MVLRPENLPRDPDRLIEMVLACEGKIEALQATITTLKTMIFGARSEKSAVIIAEQLSLGLGDAETDAALPPPANDDHKTKAAPGSRNKRNRNIGALPKPLPRCDVTIEPETTACPCCTGALHRIGEDVSEVLDKVPAILRVLRFIRPKYACRACEGTVVQAKARPRLIESGMASTALVAWIAAAKFAWGSTLYRQAQILAGHGLNIDRQTLARWMKQAAWMAKGVYELQLAAMHEHPRLFCDETPMPVLGACDGRSVMERARAAGSRLCLRGRSGQEGDPYATDRVRGGAASRRLCRLCLAGGRQEDVGENPLGVLSRSRAQELRQSPQDDELALRQGGHRAHCGRLRDRGADPGFRRRSTPRGPAGRDEAADGHLEGAARSDEGRHIPAFDSDWSDRLRARAVGGSNVVPGRRAAGAGHEHCRAFDPADIDREEE